MGAITLKTYDPTPGKSEKEIWPKTKAQNFRPQLT